MINDAGSTDLPPRCCAKINKRRVLPNAAQRLHVGSGICKGLARITDEPGLLNLDALYLPGRLPNPGPFRPELSLGEGTIAVDVAQDRLGKERSLVS